MNRPPPRCTGRARIVATRSHEVHRAPSRIDAVLVLGSTLLTAHDGYVLRWEITEGTATPVQRLAVRDLERIQLFPLVRGGFAALGSPSLRSVRSGSGRPLLVSFDAAGNVTESRELPLGDYLVLADGRAARKTSENGATVLAVPLEAGATAGAAGVDSTRCFDFGLAVLDETSGRVLLAGTGKVGVVEPTGELRVARDADRSIALALHAGALVRCRKIERWAEVEGELQTFDIETLALVRTVPCGPIGWLASDGVTLAALGWYRVVTSGVVPRGGRENETAARKGLSTKYAVLAMGEHLSVTPVTAAPTLCALPAAPPPPPDASALAHPDGDLVLDVSAEEIIDGYEARTQPRITAGGRHVVCPLSPVRLGPWIEGTRAALARCGDEDDGLAWYAVDASSQDLSLTLLGRGAGVTAHGHRVLVLDTPDGIDAVDARTGLGLARRAVAPGLRRLLAGSLTAAVVAAARDEAVVLLDARTLEELGSVEVVATRASFAPDGTLEIVDALGARVIVAIDAVPARAQ